MYMLDRFVAHVVAPYLDKYVKDLNRDHVTVSILSGNVVLHNLELRRNALRELKLPICVKRGVIRKLTVYIPWARMRTDRLRVEIEGIDITVHPKRAAQYAPGEEEAEAHQEKLEELALFEELWKEHHASSSSSSARNDGGELPDNMEDLEAEEDLPDDDDDAAAKDEERKDANAKEGYFARWRTAMLNNLQVAVRDVSVSYEDAVTDPERPVTGTLHFDELTAETTDNAWNPTVAKASDTVLFKLARLAGVRVSVARRGTTAASLAETLFSPVDVAVRARHQPLSTSPDVPRWDVTADIGDLGLSVDRGQWDAIWQSIRFVKQYDEIETFRKLRPAESVRENPRAWWHFAFKAVRVAIERRSPKIRFDWQLFWARKKLEAEYSDLHRRRQGGAWLQPLTSDDEQRCVELEKELPVGYLLKARLLALRRFELESASPAAQRASERARLARQSGGWRGWWAWTTGNRNAAGDAIVSEGDEEVWDLIDADEWTNEQRRIIEQMLEMGGGGGSGAPPASPAASPKDPPTGAPPPLASSSSSSAALTASASSAPMRPTTAINVFAKVSQVTLNMLDVDRAPFARVDLTKVGVTYESTSTTWGYGANVGTYRVLGDTRPLLTLDNAEDGVADDSGGAGHFQEIISVSSHGAASPSSSVASPVQRGLRSVEAKPNLSAKYRKLDAEASEGVEYSCSVEVQPVTVEVSVPWLQRVVDFWGVNTSLTPVNTKTGERERKTACGGHPNSSATNNNNTASTSSTSAYVPLQQETAALGMWHERNDPTEWLVLVVGLSVRIPDGPRRCSHVTVPTLTIANDVEEDVRKKRKFTGRQVTEVTVFEADWHRVFLVSVSQLRIDAEWTEPAAAPFTTALGDDDRHHHVPVLNPVDIGVEYRALLVKERTDAALKGISISAGQELAVCTDLKGLSVVLSATSLLIDFANDSSGRSAYVSAAEGGELVTTADVTAVDVVAPFSAFFLAEDALPVPVRDEKHIANNLSMDVFEPQQQQQQQEHEGADQPINGKEASFQRALQRRCVSFRYQQVSVYHRERPTMPCQQFSVVPGQYCTGVYIPEAASHPPPQEELSSASSSAMQQPPLEPDHVFVTLYALQGGAPHDVRRNGDYEAAVATLAENGVAVVSSIPQLRTLVEAKCALLRRPDVVTKRHLAGADDRIGQLQRALRVCETAADTIPCRCVTFRARSRDEAARLVRAIERAAHEPRPVVETPDVEPDEAKQVMLSIAANIPGVSLTVLDSPQSTRLTTVASSTLLRQHTVLAIQLLGEVELKHTVTLFDSCLTVESRGVVWGHGSNPRLLVVDGSSNNSGGGGNLPSATSTASADATSTPTRASESSAASQQQARQRASSSALMGALASSPPSGDSRAARRMSRVTIPAAAFDGPDASPLSPLAYERPPAASVSPSGGGGDADAAPTVTRLRRSMSVIPMSQALGSTTSVDRRSGASGVSPRSASHADPNSGQGSTSDLAGQQPPHASSPTTPRGGQQFPTQPPTPQATAAATADGSPVFALDVTVGAGSPPTLGIRADAPVRAVLNTATVASVEALLDLISIFRMKHLSNETIPSLPFDAVVQYRDDQPEYFALEVYLTAPVKLTAFYDTEIVAARTAELGLSDPELRHKTACTQGVLTEAQEARLRERLAAPVLSLDTDAVFVRWGISESANNTTVKAANPTLVLYPTLPSSRSVFVQPDPAKLVDDPTAPMTMDLGYRVTYPPVGLPHHRWLSSQSTSGFHFIHFFSLDIDGGIANYRNTHLWTIIEFFTNGLMSRFAWVANRTTVLAGATEPSKWPPFTPFPPPPVYWQTLVHQSFRIRNATVHAAVHDGGPVIFTGKCPEVVIQSDLVPGDDAAGTDMRLGLRMDFNGLRMYSHRDASNGGQIAALPRHGGPAPEYVCVMNLSCNVWHSMAPLFQDRAMQTLEILLPLIRFEGTTQQFADVWDFLCGVFMEPWINVHPVKKWAENPYTDLMAQLESSHADDIEHHREAFEAEMAAKDPHFYVMDEADAADAYQASRHDTSGGNGHGSDGIQPPRMPAEPSAPLGGGRRGGGQPATTTGTRSASTDSSGAATKTNKPLLVSELRRGARPLRTHCYDIRSEKFTFHVLDDELEESQEQFLLHSGYEPPKGSESAWVTGSQLVIWLEWDSLGAFDSFYGVTSMALVDPSVVRPMPSALFIDAEDDASVPSFPTASAKTSGTAINGSFGHQIDSDGDSSSTSSSDDDPAAPSPLTAVRSRSYSAMHGPGTKRSGQSMSAGRFVHIMAPLKIRYGWTSGPSAKKPSDDDDGSDSDGGEEEIEPRIVKGDYHVSGIEIVVAPPSFVAFRDTFLSLRVRNAAAPMFKWQPYSPGQPATPWDPKTQQDYAVCHRLRAMLVCVIVVGEENLELKRQQAAEDARRAQAEYQRVRSTTRVRFDEPSVSPPASSPRPDPASTRSSIPIRRTSLGTPLAAVNFCVLSLDSQVSPFSEATLTSVSLETLSGNVIAPPPATSSPSSSPNRSGGGGGRQRTKSVLETECSDQTVPLLVPRHESGNILHLVKSSDEGFSGEIDCFWLIAPVASKITELRTALQSNTFELLGGLAAFREDRILQAQAKATKARADSRRLEARLAAAGGGGGGQRSRAQSVHLRHDAAGRTTTTNEEAASDDDDGAHDDGTAGYATSVAKLSTLRDDVETDGVDAPKTLLDVTIHHPCLVITEHEDMARGAVIDLGTVRINATAHKQVTDAVPPAHQVGLSSAAMGPEPLAMETVTTLRCLLKQMQVISLHDQSHRLLLPVDLELDVSTSPSHTNGDLIVGAVIVDCAQQYYESLLRSAARHLVPDEADLIEKQRQRASGEAATNTGTRSRSSTQMLGGGGGVAFSDSAAAADDDDDEADQSAATASSSHSPTTKDHFLRQASHIVAEGDPDELRDRLGGTAAASAAADGLAMAQSKRAATHVRLNVKTESLVLRVHSDIICVELGVDDITAKYDARGPVSGMRATVDRVSCGVEGRGDLLQIGAPSSAADNNNDGAEAAAKRTITVDIDWDAESGLTAIKSDLQLCNIYLHESVVTPAISFLYDPYRRIVLPSYGVSELITVDDDTIINQRLILSSRKRLHVSNARFNHIELDLCGNAVHFLPSTSALIVVDPAVTLVLYNCRLHLYEQTFEQCLSTGNGGCIVLDDSVQIVQVRKEARGLVLTEDQSAARSSLDLSFALDLSLPDTAGTRALNLRAEAHYRQHVSSGDGESRSEATFTLDSLEAVCLYYGDPDSDLPSDYSSLIAPWSMVLRTDSETNGNGNGSSKPTTRINVASERGVDVRLRVGDAMLVIEALQQVSSAFGQIKDTLPGGAAKTAKTDELSVDQKLIDAEDDGTADSVTTVAINMKQLGFFLVDDSGSSLDQPLLYLTLFNVAAPTLEMTQRASSVHIRLQIQLEFYDLEQGRWRPMIEKVESDIVLKEVKALTLHDLASRRGQHRIGLRIRPLHVHLTPVMVQTLIRANDLVSVLLDTAKGKRTDATHVAHAVAASPVSNATAPVAPGSRHAAHRRRQSMKQKQRGVSQNPDSPSFPTTAVAASPTNNSNARDILAGAQKERAEGGFRLGGLTLEDDSETPSPSPSPRRTATTTTGGGGLTSVPSAARFRGRGPTQGAAKLDDAAATAAGTAVTITPAPSRSLAATRRAADALQQARNAADGNSTTSSGDDGDGAATATSTAAAAAAQSIAMGATTKGHFAQYVITQHLGFDLDVTFADSDASTRFPDPFTLPSGASAAFNFPRIEGKELAITQHNVMVSAATEGSVPLFIGKVGTSLVSFIPPRDQPVDHAREFKFVLDVSLSKGQKVVVLRSNVTFTNALPFPVHLGGVGELPPTGEAVSVPADAMRCRCDLHPMAGIDCEPVRFGLQYVGLAFLYDQKFLCSAKVRAPSDASERFVEQVAGTPSKKALTETDLRDRSTPGLPHNTNSVGQKKKRKSSSPAIATRSLQESVYFIAKFARERRPLSVSDHATDVRCSIEPPFNLVNTTGAKITVALYLHRTMHSKRAAGVLSVPQGVSFLHVATIPIQEGETMPITQVDPLADVYMDVVVEQPTGEILTRTSGDPVLIRSQFRGARAKTVTIRDQFSQPLVLRIGYDFQRIVLSSGYWVVNQTMHYVQVAEPKLLQTTHRCAGQTPDGLLPSSDLPFLMCTPSQLDDAKKSKANAIARVGRHRHDGSVEWTDWSEPFNIDRVRETHIDCKISSTTAVSLSLSVSYVGGAFKDTLLLTLLPRWIVMNRCGRDLVLTGTASDTRLGQPRLTAGQSRTIDVALRRGNNMLRLQYATTNLEVDGSLFTSTGTLVGGGGGGGPGTSQRHHVSGTSTPPPAQDSAEALLKSIASCEASDPICIDHLVETGFNMRYSTHADPSRVHFDVIRVSVYRRTGILFIAVDPVARPPHIVENRTRFSTHVKQAGSSRELIVYPRSSKGFFMESEALPQKITLSVTDTSGQAAKCLVNLDPSVLAAAGGRHAKQQVVMPVSGAVLFVRVRSWQGSFAISITSDRTIDTMLTQPFHQRALRIQIERLFVLVSESKQHLALVTVTSVDATVSQGRSAESEDADMQLADVRVGHVQIDDERKSAQQRFVLYTVPRETHSFVLLRQMDRTNPILQLKRAELNVRPLWLHLEDTFLFDLLNFADRVAEITSSGADGGGSAGADGGDENNTNNNNKDSDQLNGASSAASSPATAASKNKNRVINSAAAAIARYSRDHWSQEVNRATDENSLAWRLAMIETLVIEHVIVSVSLYRGSDDGRDPLRDRIGFLSSFIGSVNDARFDWRRVSEKNLCNKLWILADYLQQDYASQLQRQLLNLVHVAGLDSMRTIVNDLLDGYMGPRTVQTEKVVSRLEPMRKKAHFTSVTLGAIDTEDEAGFIDVGADFDDREPRMFATTSGGSVIAITKKSEPHAHVKPYSGNAGAIAVGGATLHNAQACRCADIEWERKRGRLSRMSLRVEELAHHTTWDEFTALMPPLELRRFAPLALQQHIRTRCFTEDTFVPTMCNRCDEIEEMRRERVMNRSTCALPPPDSGLLTWAEYCHHATWQDYAYLSSDDELVRYCNQVRDGLIGNATGVRRIEASMQWSIDEAPAAQDGQANNAGSNNKADDDGAGGNRNR